MTEQLPRTQYVVSHPPARGFTLIELLVVVGIISVLAAIMLPALGQARSTAKMIKEMAAARQLAQGLFYYADAHDGYYINAYASVSPGNIEVSNDLHVYDAEGRLLSAGEYFEQQARRRWVFRLAPYVEGAFRGVMYVNEGERHVPVSRGGQAAANTFYNMSLNTSFGLNAQGVGGHSSSIGGWMTDEWRRNELVMQPDREALVPSQLMTFVSTSDYEPIAGTYSYGNLLSFPPRGVDIGNWWPTTEYRTEQILSYGYVHLRYNRSAIAGFADGHVEARTEDAMRDMRIWLKNAARNNDPNYISPY